MNLSTAHLVLLPCMLTDVESFQSNVTMFSCIFNRYLTQRHERMTPLKPNSAVHQTATKRSLYRDLENQYLATQNVETVENISPRQCPTDPSYDVADSCQSTVNDTDLVSSPQKKLYNMLEDSAPNVSLKSPRKRAEQHARYVSALALIQLAHGSN